MWDALPTELCGKILTFVELRDLFVIRAVSRHWRHMAEWQIFGSLREQNKPTVVRFENESTQVQTKLYATSFDAMNGVITFEQRPSERSPIPLTCGKSGVVSPMHPKFMSICLEAWLSKGHATIAPPEQLTEKEKEIYRLHSTYNYALKRALELPRSDKIGSHLVGDHDYILSFSYCSHQSQSNRNLMPIQAVRFHWLKVSFSWLAAGLWQGVTKTPLHQIYAHRYSALSTQLARHGCFKYDATSEPILRYIMEDDSLSFNELVEYVRTHDMETRLSKLQHALPAVGVDPRMIWKYPFAKAFVTGSALLLSEDDVIRGIEGGEQECRALIQSVSKRRNCERAIQEQQRRRQAHMQSSVIDTLSSPNMS